MKISKRQREVLQIIVSVGSDSWGDVWTHYYEARSDDGGLEFRNFNRVTDALLRKGLVTEEPLRLTDAGRCSLEST